VVVAGGIGTAVTGGAVVKAASADAARRLVPTVVVFVVVAAAAAAAVLGLAMATSSTLAYQIARAKRHSPDLTLMVDAEKVTGAQLAATRNLPGVIRAAGFPATTISISVPVPRDMAPSGRVTGPVTVVGRVSGSGPLDDIRQQTGRWPARSGEIDLAPYAPARGSIGQVVTATVTSVRGRPKLTVDGYASPPTSQDQTQQAWVVPAEITALEKAGAPAQEEMAYTFRDAATPAQIGADLRELRAALPVGAMVTYASWLNTEYFWEAAGGSIAPLLMAYAIIALVLAVLIAAIVAAATVVASYRRIGALKSIGFTPAQIAATYLAQLGIPALAGAVTGTVVGSYWARPMLKVDVPKWIWLSVPIGLCVLAGLAALAPAVRAARWSSVAAITAGQAPRARRRHAAHRLAGRVRLPRPVSLGLAAPLSRPSRSAATLAVITVGLAAVVIAVGLQAQMHQIVMIPGWANNGVRLVGQLTRLVAVLAGLGVFSAVLMLARERVRDLGIFKALGMTPRQVITMVTCWAIGPAIAAAVIALPGGIALEHVVARAVVSWQTSRMAETTPPPGTGGPPSRHHAAGSGQPEHPASQRQIFLPNGRHRVINLPGHGAHGSLPPQLAQLGAHLTQAYTPGTLALLVLAGLAIAIVGALGPAIWAASSKTTTALHAE
jgi:ABC-type lipoprotein release transport system permease subunit